MLKLERQNPNNFRRTGHPVDRRDHSPGHPAAQGSSSWSGSQDELADTLRRFAAIGTDEVHLIPTSSDLDQVHRAAEVVADFH